MGTLQGVSVGRGQNGRAEWEVPGDGGGVGGEGVGGVGGFGGAFILRVSKAFTQAMGDG
jgi:hypothetical protein